MEFLYHRRHEAGHHLSILLAILIDQFRNVLFKRTVQTLIYLPTFYLDQLYTALFRQFRAMVAPSTNFLL